MRKILLAGLSAAVLSLSACHQQVDYTTVDIKDPVRHYYPILQGQELSVSVGLTNTGNVPLLIRDVQPSCGCIIVENMSNLVVPPGREIFVNLRYDSKKNVGKVEHTIRFWGNIAPDGIAEMRFDVNVVPDANYHKDYEELYDKDRSKSSLKGLIRSAGQDTGLGYYVGR